MPFLAFMKLRKHKAVCSFQELLLLDLKSVIPIRLKSLGTSAYRSSGLAA